MSKTLIQIPTGRKSLRIAIIAHPLHAGGGISVGRNMIAALGRVAPQHSYFISIPSGLGYEEVVASVPKHVSLVFSARTSLWRRWCFEHRELVPKLRRFKPDLILALANKGIGSFDCPQAILYHNSYIWHDRRHYGHYPPLEMALICLKIQVQRFFMRRDLGKPQNMMLYQTRSARNRISSMFKIKARPVHCPNAVSNFISTFQSELSTPDPIKPYADRFKIFYLARYYPHKNLEAIVEVFRRYPKELENTVAFITIEADQHHGARRLLEAIKKYGLQNHVVNVGSLPQEDLGDWFTNCNALLMPTLLESFSATYLEAMQYGLPILTSNLDFAHEVCQDAALYFDPWNAENIKDAILRLKNDPNLRNELVSKGKRNLLKSFISWDDIARTINDNLELQISK